MLHKKLFLATTTKMQTKKTDENWKKLPKSDKHM